LSEQHEPVSNASVYGTKKLSGYGNFRVIQKVDNHNIHYVSNPVGGRVIPTSPAQTPAKAAAPAKVEEKDGNGLLVAVLILMILVVLASFTILGMMCKKGQMSAVEGAGGNTS